MMPSDRSPSATAAGIGTRRALIAVEVRHGDFVVAAGVDTVLRTHDGFMVASPGTAPDADVVVSDYATGMLLAQHGRDHFGRPAVLIVSQRDREWEVRSALESGVHGYMLQSS